MYEYPLKVEKVIKGDTIKAIVDLGFSVKVHKTIRLAGVKAPSLRLDLSIKDVEERRREKERGVKAKKRLQELIKEGEFHPEGLVIETFFEKRQKKSSIVGDVRFVYARDLYNHKVGEKPWVGWKRIANALLAEGLVDIDEI